MTPSDDDHQTLDEGAPSDDEVTINRIAARYRGQMDVLDFSDKGTRDRLAFDLGCLIGMCHRLLKQKMNVDVESH